MGVYYRLVNLKTRERIEPGSIGGGGVKHRAVVCGPAANLLAFMHLWGRRDWTVLADGDDAYYEAERSCANATERYVEEFNRHYPADTIVTHQDTDT